MSVISARALHAFACLRHALLSRQLLGGRPACAWVQGAIQPRRSILCAKRRQKDAGATGTTRKQLKTNIDVRTCSSIDVKICAGVCASGPLQVMCVTEALRHTVDPMPDLNNNIAPGKSFSTEHLISSACVCILTALVHGCNRAVRSIPIRMRCLAVYVLPVLRRFGSVR